MPRGEPGKRTWLSQEQAERLGKGKPGRYRLTEAERVKLSHVTAQAVPSNETVPQTVPSSVTPSLAFPRQIGRCIRCGARIPAADNFCSDAHYSEHLAWMRRPRGETPRTARVVELRALLDDAKLRYSRAQRDQDWPTCTAINAEREPWFAELAGIDPQGDYFIPVRFLPRDSHLK